MNAFEALLNLSDAEKKTRGLEHTPREIAQQPGTWGKAARILVARGKEISGFFSAKLGCLGRRKLN